MSNDLTPTQYQQLTPDQQSKYKPVYHGELHHFELRVKEPCLSEEEIWQEVLGYIKPSLINEVWLINHLKRNYKISKI